MAEVRATIKEKKLAENMIMNVYEFRFKTLHDLLIASGYAETVAKDMPGAVIQQKGVQAHLAKLGFNEEAAKAVVAEILLLGKEENRIKAAQEVFKVHGSYAPEKHNVQGVVGVILKEIQSNEDPLVT